MKVKTVGDVRESYTFVNKSEAFLACIDNPTKVYVTYNTFELNRYKFNKIAFLVCLIYLGVLKGYLFCVVFNFFYIKL